MKEKTRPYTGAILITLLLIPTSIELISNSKDKRNYNEEKLGKESVMSQKLKVSQELDKVKSDMAELTAVKESNDKEFARQIPGGIDTPRKVAFTYTPNEKLNAGEYKIRIFSNDKNIGNCRLRLE